MAPKGASGEKKRQAAKQGPKQKHAPKVNSFRSAAKAKPREFVNPYEGAEPCICSSCESSTLEPERSSLDPVGSPKTQDKLVSLWGASLARPLVPVP